MKPLRWRSVIASQMLEARRSGLVGRQHDQQPTLVIVVGGEDVGDGIRRKVTLGVHLDRLALNANLSNT